MLEMVNTSARQGLDEGSEGFCTVARSEHLPPALADKLTLLSGYRLRYGLTDMRAGLNPPVQAHSLIALGSTTYSILSQVVFLGESYQGRMNRLAHHVVLDPRERVPGGPAWVMRDENGVMLKEWTDEPQILPPDRVRIPAGSGAEGPCTAWQALAGDAGWAGVLVDAYIRNSDLVSYILYEPGMQMLPLIDEAIALLPEQMRWRVTFNTYFDALPPGMAYSWRCCALGSKAADQARQHASSGVVIDLSQALGQADDGHYVRLARGMKDDGAGQPAAAQIGAGGFEDMIVYPPTQEEPAAPEPAAVELEASEPQRVFADLDEMEHAGGVETLPHAPHRRVQSGRPIWIWLLVAVALVAGVLIGGRQFLFGPQQDDAEIAATGNAPAAAAERPDSGSDDALAALQQELARATALAGKRAAALKQMERERDTFAKQLQAAQQALRTAEEEVADLRDQLTQLQESNRALLQAMAQKLTANAPAMPTVVTDAVLQVPAYEVDSVFGTLKDTPVVLGAAPGAERLAVTNLKRVSRVSARMEEKQVAFSCSGPEQAAKEVGRIYVQNDRLYWTWESVGVKGIEGALRGLQKSLTTAQVEVFAGDTVVLRGQIEVK